MKWVLPLSCTQNKFFILHPLKIARFTSGNFYFLQSLNSLSLSMSKTQNALESKLIK